MRRSDSLLGSIPRRRWWSLPWHACVWTALACSAAPEPSSPQAALALPSTVVAHVVEGAPNPAPRVVELRNNGTCALDFTVQFFTANGVAWLDVTPTAGQVAAAGTAQLTLALDTQGQALVPGAYTASVVVSGTCSTTGQPARGSPRGIAVNLNVTPPLPSGLVDEWLPLDGTTQPPARARVLWDNGLLGMLCFGGVDDGGIPMAQPYLYVGGTGWTALDVLPNAPLARVAGSVTAFSSEYTGFLVWGGRVAGNMLTNTGSRLVDDFGSGMLLWEAVSPVGMPSAREFHTATAAGLYVVVWGGLDENAVPLGDGARYRINFNDWSTVTAVDAPEPRANHVAVGVDQTVLIWGGSLVDGILTNTGGQYQAAMDVWLPMGLANAPTARTGMTAVTDGVQMMVFGGQDASGVTNTGARYDPMADMWTPLPTAGAPSPRRGHVAVWSGTHMLVWGGEDAGGNPLGDGAAYDPTTDTWLPITNLGAPPARAAHVASWVGDRMVVVHGQTATGVTAGGKAYR